MHLRRKTGLVVTLVIIVLLLAAACGGDADAPPPVLPATPMPTAAQAPTATPMPTAAQAPTATPIPTAAQALTPTADVADGGAEVALVIFDGIPAGAVPNLGVGLPVPGLSGSALDGTPFRWTPGTSPTAIVFLAHWCPACQAEVAELTRWLDEGNKLPEGVELFGVSTRVNPERDNYPPSRWLNDEGWPFPVLMDDAADTVATAFGLSGTPFWAFIDADGLLVNRGSGRIAPDALAGLLNQMLAGGQG